MKFLLILSLFSAFLIIGCENNTLVSPFPETEYSQQSSNLLKIPIDLPMFVLKLMDSKRGANFILDTTYINSEGRQINVYARLRFPADAFQGAVEIVMAPNVEDLSIQLFPEMVFDKVVKLDVVFTGVDLKAFGYTTNSQVDFVYFNDDGTIEPIESNSSDVNVHNNRISVRNAQLHHFSRYGWSR